MRKKDNVAAFVAMTWLLIILVPLMIVHVLVVFL